MEHVEHVGVWKVANQTVSQSSHSDSYKCQRPFATSPNAGPKKPRDQTNQVWRVWWNRPKSDRPAKKPERTAEPWANTAAPDAFGSSFWALRSNPSNLPLVSRTGHRVLGMISTVELVDSRVLCMIIYSYMTGIHRVLTHVGDISCSQFLWARTVMFSLERHRARSRTN